MARLILNYPRCAELVLVLDAEDKNAYFRAIFVPEESLCVKVLEHLRGFGGNIKQKDKNNQTILYFAARLEHEEVVRYLMRFDFPLNDNDFFSQTPLFYASKFNKRTQISESFLKAGCEVNHRDNNGQTCLFYAAGSGNLEICQLLVDYGANVQHLDKNREKASNYARKNGHMRVVQYLHLCKNDARKQKEERRQESSQNTAERRKRKEIVRNEYCLVFTNENGEVKVLTPQELQKFKAASEDHNRLHRLMAEPDEPIDALAPVPDKRFERIAMKILNHFWKLESNSALSQTATTSTSQSTTRPSPCTTTPPSCGTPWTLEPSNANCCTTPTRISTSFRAT